MTKTRLAQLDRPVDPDRDHVLGAVGGELTLVEYGSYACSYCHAAHKVVARLRERFGDRLTYVYRHLPLTDRAMATKAAELAEYASATQDRFWEVHEAFMKRSPNFDDAALKKMAAELGIPADAELDPELKKAVARRVREDAQSGLRSGTRMTPTFFINGRRYEGAWDEDALAEALVGSVGQRIQTVLSDFVRWAPSIGLLLLVAIIAALGLANSPLGPAVDAFWHSPLGLRLGEREFSLSALDWVNHGLLTVFFLVVGLEIKREFTVGRLRTRMAATLPVAAAAGGMLLPAMIYVAIAPRELAGGWGVTIATDTAFAIALMVLLGDRVPAHLRVFLTAAVIVDDLVAIAVVAAFYTEKIAPGYLAGAAAVTVLLIAFNRWNIYRVLPYAASGVLLWFFLHEAGIHATLAGVILAVLLPTRPPPDARALTAQAQLVVDVERRMHPGQGSTRRLSESALHALEVIYDRIESPASKVGRSAEPWSNYVVLPIFALANAGLVFRSGLLDGQATFVLALVLGLVIGKPLGILGGAWIAVRVKAAAKPEEYTWRQLAGAGAFGGIGFTMSLFIAAQAYPDPARFSAAKVAIFIASTLAGIVGVVILLRRPPRASRHESSIMTEIRSVSEGPATMLVPLDGSDKDDRAIAAAAAMVRLTGSHARLIRVFSPPASSMSERMLTMGGHDAIRKRTAEASLALGASLDRLASATGTEVVAEIVEGFDVGQALLDRAARPDVALVVMATRAPAAPDRALRGSVADRIMRESARPVLLVPPGSAHGPMTLRRVLVSLDSSRRSMAALDRLVELDRDRRMDYLLVEVVPGGETASTTVREAADRLRAQGARDAQVRIVADADPAAAILRVALEEGVDFIAMTPRGLTGMPRLLLGSVSAGVIAGSNVPVFLFTSPESS